MKLISDFRDYYDWAFDGKGEEFIRLATNTGPDKRGQFEILRDAGYKTPPFGRYDEVIGQDWAEGWVKYVVAYTDPMAHVGEGKEVWDRRKASVHVSARMDPDWVKYERVCSTFCSALVPGPTGVSWRELHVGPHVFMIEYTSNSDWRSNCGEGDIELLESRPNVGYHPKIRLPLFAIDFVHGAKDMYAVDFNIAPGIRGSGVEKELPSLVCALDLEKAWYDLIGHQQ